jgi:hypothetical protein
MKIAEWFEVRLGQNLLKQGRTISGVRSNSSGLEDLYLGVKLAFSRPRRWVPGIALIPQMTVPTGNQALTGGRPLFGVNIDGNWEIVKNRYSIEFVVANNRVADDASHSHLELATGITHAFQLNRKLEAFGEWDVFRENIDPVPIARHYAVGGLVFFAREHFAMDFRAGAGLNAEANRFLLGIGFAFRK